METTKALVQACSTKKLRMILDQQSAAYPPDFLAYAKSELIQRGEQIPFDEEYVSQIAQMPDEELKLLVEQEYKDYHLEYMEIARAEYLKRGFVFEAPEPDEEYEPETGPYSRYPLLWTISKILTYSAWIIGLIAVAYIILALPELSKVGSTLSGLFLLFMLFTGALFIIGLLTQAEMIKLFLDIENNTRKQSEE